LKELINERVEDMRSGVIPGDYIKDRPYPTIYRQYSNLYEIRLSDYWRLIFTIIGSRKERVCLLLDFIGHDVYDRLFHHKQS
jgi:hypothetical protein